MEIRPILSSLRRNPVAALLIAAQIALTLAILANVLFIVGERLRLMNLPSGIDEDHVFVFANQNIAGMREPAAANEEDLAALRAMPGVLAASATFTYPMGRSGWQTTITTRAGEQVGGAERSSALYFADTQFLDALGTRIVEGRNFEPGEIGVFQQGDQPDPPVVLVSKGLAERLFPGERALGKMIDITGNRGEPGQRIVGVVDAIATPWPRSQNADRVVFVPYTPAGIGGFIVRTAPGERDRVMGQVEDTLFKLSPHRIIPNLRSFETVRADTFRNDRAMAVLLAVIGVALLAITAFGIVGQASFWVVQRTKQIGTRRALGARRRDILRYFQVENALIAVVGIGAGSLLALTVNALLVKNLGFDRLPWTWLPVGAIVVILLGQLAVFGPARRASRIPPAIATRSA